jgi:hypothetical protein
MYGRQPISGRPTRIDGCARASGPGAVPTEEWGGRAAVGAPIRMEGWLWGVMFAASRDGRALPPGTEGGTPGFTDLAATAIADAGPRAALRACRARVVAAAITVQVLAADDGPQVRVCDDGADGARLGAGSGLKDQVEAFGGHFTLHSQPGAGTTVTARVPQAVRERPWPTRPEG